MSDENSAVLGNDSSSYIIGRNGVIVISFDGFFLSDFFWQFRASVVLDVRSFRVDTVPQKDIPLVQHQIECQTCNWIGYLL